MMPLAPQLSVPHIGQISVKSSPNIRNNMKASKPKLSFSIDSIVGKRKAFEYESGEGSLNETELLAKSIKRHLSENNDFANEHRSNSSPRSVGHRSPDLLLHRHSVSPLSTGSLSGTPTTTSNQPLGNLSPLRSPSPLALVANTQSPNTNSLATMPGQQFLNRPALGMPVTHSTMQCNMPQPPSGQMPQVAPLGHPNHPMMVAAAAAAAAASSAHQFPPMPSDYQQAAAFYPWFLRANPFAGRFPGKCKKQREPITSFVLSLLAIRHGFVLNTN